MVIRLMLIHVTVLDHVGPTEFTSSFEDYRHGAKRGTRPHQKQNAHTKNVLRKIATEVVAEVQSALNIV
jgi:hypothetical protein